MQSRDLSYSLIIFLLSFGLAAINAAITWNRFQMLFWLALGVAFVLLSLSRK